MIKSLKVLFATTRVIRPESLKTQKQKNKNKKQTNKTTKKGIYFSCIKLLQSYVCMVTISCSLRHQWVGHHLNLQSITNKPTHSTQTGWVEHGVQANGHLAAPPPGQPPKSLLMHLRMLASGVAMTKWKWNCKQTLLLGAMYWTKARGIEIASFASFHDLVSSPLHSSL